MGTGKVALTSENGEIKRNVSFGKSKPELTFLFIISSKEADRKKEYKKILKQNNRNHIDIYRQSI